MGWGRRMVGLERDMPAFAKASSFLRFGGRDGASARGNAPQWRQGERGHRVFAVVTPSAEPPQTTSIRPG